MQKNNESKSRNVALWIVGGVALVATAAVVTPVIVKQLTNAYYRANTGVEDIDFNDMGPTIVNRQGEPVEVEHDAD